MVEERFIFTEIWKNQEALLMFLKGQDARHGSSECRRALNSIAPLIIAAPIVKKKRGNFAIVKGYIYTKGISDISTINAPKRRRSTGNGNSQVMLNVID